MSLTPKPRKHLAVGPLQLVCPATTSRGHFCSQVSGLGDFLIGVLQERDVTDQPAGPFQGSRSLSSGELLAPLWSAPVSRALEGRDGSSQDEGAEVSWPGFTLTPRLTAGELAPFLRPSQSFSLWSSALNPEFLWLTLSPLSSQTNTLTDSWCSGIKGGTHLSALGSNTACPGDGVGVG